MSILIVRAPHRKAEGQPPSCRGPHRRAAGETPGSLRWSSLWDARSATEGFQDATAPGTPQCIIWKEDAKREGGHDKKKNVEIAQVPGRSKDIILLPSRVSPVFDD